MNTSFRIFVAIFIIPVASAYVNIPDRLVRRHLVPAYVPESRPPSNRYARNTNNNSFGEKRDRNNNRGSGNANPNGQQLQRRTQKKYPNRLSILERSRIIAQFCSEVGCTIQDYQRTTDLLKYLKVELSNEMLSVEDELDRHRDCLKFWEDVQNELPRIPQLSGTPPIIPFPSWWSSIPNEVQNGVGNVDGDEKRMKSNSNSNSNKGAITAQSQITIGSSRLSRLEERRKKLSDRALSIQNLLATLQAMEDSTNPIGTRRTSPVTFSYKKLADRYRRIVWGEGIDITLKITLSVQETTLNALETPRGTSPFSYMSATKELADRYRRIAWGEGTAITSKITLNALETARGASQSSFSYMRSLWTQRQMPKPPLLPPTTRQFMNQPYSEDSNVDEKNTREWFGRTRDTTYPVSASAPSKSLAQKFGRMRAATNPFSGSANSTSTSSLG